MLQANNAIIYGKIYASEGWFKGSVSADNGYFRGDVYADDGYFKGSISAETGYFSKGIRVGYNGPTFEDYLDDKIMSAMTSGMSPEMVNDLINNYLTESGITMNGYLSQEYFDEWVAAWNASHSANPLTEEEIQQLARATVGAEISQVFGISANTDGSLRHSVKIGNNTYYWDTFRTEDYMLLGDWTGDSGHSGTGFCVSTNGLLEANNAVIYGKVYASEGYFKGKVEADEGYFHGDVVANSLTLGNSYGGGDLSDYISGRLASVSGMDATAVNGLIASYISSQNFLSGDALNGYVTSENLEAWLATQSGLTSAYIHTIVNAMSGSQINSTRTEPNGSGGTRHIINIGGVDYTWDTWDAGDFVLLNTEYSGSNGTDVAKFLVSKDGLLQANNAIIHGQIYATNGWFKGSVSATNGEFRGTVHAENGDFNGAITATSLTLASNNNKTIEEYVDGRVADAVASGMDSSMVNQLITDYVNASGDSMGFVTNQGFQNWVTQWNLDHPDDKIDATAASAIAQSIFNSEISKVFSDTTTNGVTTHTATIGDRTYSWKTVDTGDYVLVDTGLGTVSSAGTGGFIISREGLLEAYNALIYGKIYASEGYFKGSISADSGSFRGDVIANSLTLGSNAYVSGAVYATKGVFKDVSATNISMSNSFFSGNVYANNGYFKGDIEANSLKLLNNASVSGKVEATSGKFENGTFKKVTATNFSATNSYFSGKIYANDGEFNGAITATTLKLGSQTYSSMPSSLSSGDVKNLINNAASTSGWIKQSDGYYQINHSVGENFKVDTNGLLVANNAILSGSVYATNGVFSGTVYAGNGKFSGDITANTLTLGNNAVVSGAVYATKGVFKDVSATNISMKNSFFSGNVYATNGYFSGEIQATKGKFENGTIKNITATTFSATNAYLSGKIVANSGSFKGSISADSGYFNGTLCAATGSFKGNLTAAGGTFKGDLTAAGGSFKGSISANNGYFKGTLCAATGTFGGKLTAANGSFDGDVTARTLYVGTTEIDSYIDGKIPDIPNSDDFVLIDEAYYTGTGVNQKYVKIQKNGLLTARNAIISGTVYANTGVFKGNVYADNGYFKGNITADTLTLGEDYGSLDIDSYVGGEVASRTSKMLEYNVTYSSGTGQSQYSFKVDSHGLLQAKNAIISGTVYATNGVFKGDVYANNGKFHGSVSATDGCFKGSVSADNGYFKGTLCAATGVFSGAVKATSLQLGNDIISSIPDTTGMLKQGVYYSAGTGVNKKEFYVSTDGLLQARNAIISGTVYANDGFFKGSISATNGHFSGIIDASDIYLGGKALKFGIDDDKLLITNEAITVDYVPKSINITAETIAGSYTPYGSNPWYVDGYSMSRPSGTCQEFNFTATGNTYVKIPKRQVSFTAEWSYNNSSDSSHLSGPATAYTFYKTTGQAGKTLLCSGYTTIEGYYGRATGNATLQEKSISVTNGKSYTAWTEVKADITIPGSNGGSIQIDCPAFSVLVPGGNPSDIQQVKIGSNGLQIFLGNSFYLTAANRLTGTDTGPIIAMGGKVNGVMKTIKIDSSGLVIDQ